MLPLVFAYLRRSFLPGMLLAVVLPGTSLSAEAPLRPTGNQPTIAGKIFFEEQLASVNRALESGLPGLAATLSAKLLAQASIDPSQQTEVAASRAAALIARQRFEEARRVLQTVPETMRGAVHWLYLAAALYGDSSSVDGVAMRAALDRVEVSALDDRDAPWYYLLTGLLAEWEGSEIALDTIFERAAAEAVSPEQAAFFRSLSLRELIRGVPVDASLASVLRREVEANWGTPSAFAFVQQRVVVLYKLGRRADAERLIDRALGDPVSGLNARARDQLLLIRAMLQGEDSISGRAALRELIRNGLDREVMLAALQLLADVNSDLGRAEFSDFLNEMIDGARVHPLLGQMYYLRSELALAGGNSRQAESDARFLLEQYPGLEQIDNVYRMFAFAALQRTPPQYRVAADFLNQLRERDLPNSRRRLIDRLIGDCYFLKGDYADAADFYRSARAVDGEGEVGLFLRLATAELRDGQLDAAIEYVDAVDAAGAVPVLERWQVEWNLARSLQARGAVETALSRLQRLFDADADATIPAALDLRLRWLEARLRMSAGLTEDLLSLVDALLVRIESIPQGMLEAEDAQLLATESLLLKAELVFQSGDAEGGRTLLFDLRKRFAVSEATERSFLLEADFYLEAGNLEASQKTLAALAEQYPESRFAPQALLEAALTGQSRGADYFEDAVRILEILAENYPEDPLVFLAKLKQGDLLRLMNDFTGAQIIYENLINRYPEHPRQYVAVLGQADCLLAQARNEPDKLEKASQIFERLLDLTNLPVDYQAEVACKYAFLLEKRGLDESAESVRALAVGRLLLDQENALQLGEPGRYWMARALFDLGSGLEERGDAKEARRVYRKILAYNLPGQNLARERSDRLEGSQE